MFHRREFDYVAVWSVENVTSDEVIAFDPRVDDPFGKLQETQPLEEKVQREIKMVEEKMASLPKATSPTGGGNTAAKERKLARYFSYFALLAARARRRRSVLLPSTGGRKVRGCACAG